MSQASVYFKLVLVDQVNQKIAYSRQRLTSELQSLATDPMLFKRRCRMLSQLAGYEGQIYKKIHAFDSDQMADYRQAISDIGWEIQQIVNPNG